MSWSFNRWSVRFGEAIEEPKTVNKKDASERLDEEANFDIVLRIAKSTFYIRFFNNWKWHATRKTIWRYHSNAIVKYEMWFGIADDGDDRSYGNSALSSIVICFVFSLSVQLLCCHCKMQFRWINTIRIRKRIAYFITVNWIGKNVKRK